MQNTNMIDNQEFKLVQMRESFAEKFCQEKGFNRNDLTLEQVQMIRQQDNWKNPKN